MFANPAGWHSASSYARARDMASSSSSSPSAGPGTDERFRSEAWLRLTKLAKDNLPLSDKLESFIVAVVYPGGIRPADIKAASQLTELTPEQIRILVPKLKGKPFTSTHGIARHDDTKEFVVPPIRIGTIEEATLDEEGRMLALIKIDSTPEGIFTAAKIANGIYPDVSMMHYSRTYFDEGKMGIDIEHVAATDKGYEPQTHILGYFPKDDPKGYRIFKADTGLIGKAAVRLLAPAAAQSGCLGALKDICEIFEKRPEAAPDPEPEPAPAEPAPEPTPVEPASSDQMEVESAPAATPAPAAPTTEHTALYTSLLQSLNELKAEMAAMRAARAAPPDAAAPPPEPEPTTTEKTNSQSTVSAPEPTPKDVGPITAVPPALPTPVASTLSPGSQLVTVQNSASTRDMATPAPIAAVPTQDSAAAAAAASSSMAVDAADPASQHDGYTDIPEIAAIGLENIIEYGPTADRPVLYATALAYADQINVLRDEKIALQQKLTESEKRHLDSLEDAVKKVLAAGGDTNLEGVSEAVRELQQTDKSGQLTTLLTKVMNSASKQRTLTDEDAQMEFIRRRRIGALGSNTSKTSMPVRQIAVQNSQHARLDKQPHWRFEPAASSSSSSSSRSSDMDGVSSSRRAMIAGRAGQDGVRELRKPDLNL